MITGTEPIRIIITGGTFDKDYDPLSGTLTFRDTHLGRILEDVRLSVPVELEINQLTDSLEMSHEQRMGVVRACLAAPEERVLVTHGTDTMTVTAELIQQRMTGAGREDGAGEKRDKTVVFTGAMVPCSVSGSDAVFNLGCAVAAVQLLGPGVYVVMNGTVFQAGRVRKNPANGVFEVTDEDCCRRHFR